MAERRPARYDEDDVALILRETAAASDAPAESPARATGWSLAELQEIGREVGIPEEAVRREAERLRHDPEPTSPLWGAPTRFERERRLPAHLPPDRLGAVAAEIRRATGRTGETRDVAGTLEWSWTDGIGPIVVAVSSRPDGTVLQVLADRTDEAGLWLGFAPFLGLLVGFVVDVTAGLSGLPSIGATVGGAGLATAAARWAWKLRSRSLSRRLERIADAVAARLEDAAEDAAERAAEGAAESATEGAAPRRGAHAE